MFELDAYFGANELLRNFLLSALIIAARVVPIIQMVPYFGGQRTPQVVKMGLSMALTFLLLPILIFDGAWIVPTGITLALVVFKEVLVGVMFGFVASLAFYAMQIAGQFIDQVRGQTMATVLAPMTGERTSVTSDFLYLFSVAIFLVMGGHHLAFSALLKSYKALEVFSGISIAGSQVAALEVARLVADVITIGVMFSFPVVAAVLLSEITLGLINRAAPQINVFFLGMPLKAMVGIFALFLSLGMIVDRFFVKAATDLESLVRIFELLGATS